MELLDNPNYMAAGYALHLYCKYRSDSHVFAEFPHEYTGELGSKCRTSARRAGWILHKDGTATCPKCAKELRASEPASRDERR